MIDTAPFGATRHNSTRVIFGAAALSKMSQDRADDVLELLLEHGINHIDTAARYGASEDLLKDWLAVHREKFFLASKTGDRDYAGAKASIERSLERMGVEQLDMIQLHNLVDEPGWEQAFGQDGALRAVSEAKEQGLVRFIGVTGHGTYAPAMHQRSLDAYDFDAVLLPCNYTMLQTAQYRGDFKALVQTCRQRNVAVQTIKAIARRRWQDDTQKRFSWYEPIRDEAALSRSVGWVLSQPGLFLNSTSDATLLPAILQAAADSGAPSEAEMQADTASLAVEPLFVRDVSDGV